MSFDLSGSLRRLKPQRPTAALVRRADSALPGVATPVGPGLELLLDTCVYIDVLQGCTPPAVDELLTQRILNHFTVALSELTHLFGRLNPARPATRATLRELAGVIDNVPAHRLTAPSVRASGEAGMLAGQAARAAGLAHGVGLLNDALLLLHAAESGCVLLTRNIADMDRLQQRAPHAAFLVYHRA